MYVPKRFGQVNGPNFGKEICIIKETLHRQTSAWLPRHKPARQTLFRCARFSFFARVVFAGLCSPVFVLFRQFRVARSFCSPVLLSPVFLFTRFVSHVAPLHPFFFRPGCFRPFIFARVCSPMFLLRPFFCFAGFVSPVLFVRPFVPPNLISTDSKEICII